MKEVFKHLVIFVALVIAFSSLSACTSTETTQNADASNANSVAEKPSSDFPLVPSALAQADIDLIDGTKTKVSDRKGKVLLLNLWGIWCIPCISEMPHLVKMQDKYREQGFQIIGLNVGDEDAQPEDINKIKEFAAKQGLNYELARLSDSFAVDFNKITKFEGVPQTILIDRGGHLRGVFKGAAPDVVKSMEENVEKVVNE